MFTLHVPTSHFIALFYLVILMHEKQSTGKTAECLLLLFVFMLIMPCLFVCFIKTCFWTQLLVKSPRRAG